MAAEGPPSAELLRVEAQLRVQVELLESELPPAAAVFGQEPQVPAAPQYRLRGRHKKYGLRAGPGAIGAA